MSLKMVLHFCDAEFAKKMENYDLKKNKKKQKKRDPRFSYFLGRSRRANIQFYFFGLTSALVYFGNKIKYIFNDFSFFMEHFLFFYFFINVHMVEHFFNFAYHSEQMEARNVQATKMAGYLDNENIV